MDNKSVSIEHGLPEPNVLLVIFRLNPDQYQLPFMLAFFNGQKFVIIGGDSSAVIEKEFIAGYHYILDEEGNRRKAF